MMGVIMGVVTISLLETTPPSPPQPPTPNTLPLPHFSPQSVPNKPTQRHQLHFPIMVARCHNRNNHINPTNNINHSNNRNLANPSILIQPNPPRQAQPGLITSFPQWPSCQFPTLYKPSTQTQQRQVVVLVVLVRTRTKSHRFNQTINNHHKSTINHFPPPPLVPPRNQSTFHPLPNHLLHNLVQRQLR